MSCVVVGVDGTTEGLRAVAWGAQAAARRRIPLSLVAVPSAPAPYGTGIGLPLDRFTEAETEGRGWLAEAVAVAEGTVDGGRGTGLVDIRTEVANGAVSHALADRARDAVLLVVADTGMTGPSGSREPLAVWLSSHAECPVVVVRWTEQVSAPPADGPVVVGVDGSPLSVGAVDVAFEEAALRGARLVAVHAAGEGSWRERMAHRRSAPWGEGETAEQILLAEQLAGSRERYPDVVVDRVVTHDNAASGLLRRAEAAQLLVVGSRGRGQWSGRVLGSTSQALLHSAPCPLLVVRSAGWQHQTAGAGERPEQRRGSDR